MKEIVFPANNSDDMHLGNLLPRCSSLLVEIIFKRVSLKLFITNRILKMYIKKKGIEKQAHAYFFFFLKGNGRCYNSFFYY
jgi:hypothetical protein